MNTYSNVGLGVAISGRMGSGKDTIAELMEVRQPDEFPAHMPFERLRIRDIIEVQCSDLVAAVDMAESEGDPGDVDMEHVLGIPHYKISAHDKGSLINAALSVLRQDFSPDGNGETLWPKGTKRSQIQREILQKVSRITSMALPGFYAGKAGAMAEEMLSCGRSVLSTDARLPVELSAMQSAGLVTVVLEASETERVSRIMARDGTMPSRDQLDHITELGVDEAKDFADLILNTGNMDPMEVTESIIEHVRNCSCKDSLPDQTWN